MMALVDIEQVKRRDQATASASTPGAADFDSDVVHSPANGLTVS
jgi:hypothetical protein